MKEFDCGAVIPGCSETLRGEDDEEILAQVAEHARQEHGIAHLEPEVRERVLSLTRDAA